MKKAGVITLLILIDGIISFIVFFLFTIGFGTMSAIGSVENLQILKQEANSYFWETCPMFISEIMIGLALICISNFFLIKLISKRYKVIVLIVAGLYLILFISLYFYFCNDYINRNIGLSFTE